MDEPAHNPQGVPDLEDRVLPWSQVKVISGLSRTTVWRLQKTGDFPASVQVSPNRIGWWGSEILEWRRSRIPRRLPAPKPAKAPTERASAPRAARTSKPDHDERPPAAQQVSPPPPPPPRPARRRRAPAVPDGQTAFDFGP